MSIIIPSIPCIGPSLEELKAAQKNVQNFCKETYVGTLYTNASSGDSILVTAGGVKHTSHVAKPTLIRSLYILPQIIETANKTGMVRDKLGRPDIACVHKYEADMSDGDLELIALIIVRESASGMKNFYDLSFLKR